MVFNTAHAYQHCQAEGSMQIHSCMQMCEHLYESMTSCADVMVNCGVSGAQLAFHVHQETGQHGWFAINRRVKLQGSDAHIWEIEV